MNTFCFRFVITCLLALSFIGEQKAQQLSSKTALPKEGDGQTNDSKVILPEEKLIRDAYAKLTMLSKAALLINREDADDSPDEKLFLKFELNNFRVGPIQEI